MVAFRFAPAPAKVSSFGLQCEIGRAIRRGEGVSVLKQEDLAGAFGKQCAGLVIEIAGVARGVFDMAEIL